MISRWEEYMSKVRPKQGKKVEVKAVADLFPFCKYFSNAPQPVFKGRSYEEDMDIAEGCYRHIKKIFTQLEVRMSDTHTYISAVPSLAIQHLGDIQDYSNDGGEAFLFIALMLLQLDSMWFTSIFT